MRKMTSRKLKPRGAFLFQNLKNSQNNCWQKTIEQLILSTHPSVFFSLAAARLLQLENVFFFVGFIIKLGIFDSLLDLLSIIFFLLLLSFFPFLISAAPLSCSQFLFFSSHSLSIPPLFLDFFFLSFFLFLFSFLSFFLSLKLPCFLLSRFFPPKPNSCPCHLTSCKCCGVQKDKNTWLIFTQST